MNAGKTEREREVLHRISGYENYHSHYENLPIKKNPKMKLSYDTVAAALAIQTSNTSHHAAQIICSFMYIIALFTILE